MGNGISKNEINPHCGQVFGGICPFFLWRSCPYTCGNMRKLCIFWLFWKKKIFPTSLGSIPRSGQIFFIWYLTPQKRLATTTSGHTQKTRLCLQLLKTYVKCWTWFHIDLFLLMKYWLLRQQWTGNLKTTFFWLDSLHGRLNSHYEAWSSKKKKHKKIKAYRKSV